MTGHPVRIGLIGCGLMGRELAGVVGRWPVLSDSEVRPELRAVCDVDRRAVDWFDRVASVTVKATDYHRLLDDPTIDALYVAVPHHLHERVYLDAIAAGKDFLAEKPFGIDLPAAGAIVAALAKTDTFVRVSSEMPFFPGAQQALAYIRAGRLGSIIEARFSFLHSSDLDPDKPINWKRQVQFCGEGGVMADLGMHVLHIPLRLGWVPRTVFATLQDIVRFRPGPDGRPIPCDTVDNAYLIGETSDGVGSFPIHLETKRLAPGELNTWSLRVLGTDGGVEFTTRSPQLLRTLTTRPQQGWCETGTGSQSATPTVTGGIFEFGFPDALLQMWAAFLAERAGTLGDRFGCVTPSEALTAHHVIAAALASDHSGQRVPVRPDDPDGSSPVLRTAASPPALE